jgi:hypothetical protein
MRTRRTSQVIAASVTLLSALTIVSALISLRYRTLQERNYAAPRIAPDVMPQLARGSDGLTAAVRAFAATGDGRCCELPTGIPV